MSAKAATKVFAIKLFHFCDLTTQGCFILQEEVDVSRRELSSVVDTFRDFVKTFDRASESVQILLPKPKREVASTKSKDNLFAQYCKDIIEHPTRHIRLSFRFQSNNSCLFKKFELYGNHFILTEIVNLNHRASHHLYKNQYFVANKCEIIESNYDMFHIHP